MKKNYLTPGKKNKQLPNRLQSEHANPVNSQILPMVGSDI